MKRKTHFKAFDSELFFNYLFNLHLFTSHRIHTQSCAPTARNETVEVNNAKNIHAFSIHKFAICHICGIRLQRSTCNLQNQKRMKMIKTNSWSWIFIYGREVEVGSKWQLYVHWQQTINVLYKMEIDWVCMSFAISFVEKKVIKDLKVALLEVCSIRLLLAVTAARHTPSAMSFLSDTFGRCWRARVKNAPIK